MNEENLTNARAPRSVDQQQACSATVEPLKAVEWQFPLGSCHARLSIVADATGEITPEDMDALTEIAALMKRQLVRRQGESQNNQAQTTPEPKP